MDSKGEHFHEILNYCGYNKTHVVLNNPKVNKQ